MASRACPSACIFLTLIVRESFRVRSYMRTTTVRRLNWIVQFRDSCVLPFFALRTTSDNKSKPLRSILFLIYLPMLRNRPYHGILRSIYPFGVDSSSLLKQITPFPSLIRVYVISFRGGILSYAPGKSHLLMIPYKSRTTTTSRRHCFFGGCNQPCFRRQLPAKGSRHILMYHNQIYRVPVCSIAKASG